MNERRVKIVGDGTPFGTRVIDAESGDEILVSKVEISIDAAQRGHYAATVTIFSPTLDLETNANVIHICAACRNEVGK